MSKKLKLKQYTNSGRNTYSYIYFSIYNSLCEASQALFIAAGSEFLLSQTRFHHKPLILYDTPLKKKKEERR